jgi:hypothetical protein
MVPSCAFSETTGCFSILQGWPNEELSDYAESLMHEWAQAAPTAGGAHRSPCPRRDHRGAILAASPKCKICKPWRRCRAVPVPPHASRTGCDFAAEETASVFPADTAQESDADGYFHEDSLRRENIESESTCPAPQLGKIQVAQVRAKIKSLRRRRTTPVCTTVPTRLSSIWRPTQRATISTSPFRPNNASPALALTLAMGDCRNQMSE